MLTLTNKDGRLKIPVKAYNNYDTEYMIYQTSFGKETLKDVVLNRVCSVHSKFTLLEFVLIDLQQKLIDNGYLDCILVGVET